MDDNPIMVVTEGKFYIMNRKTNKVCVSHYDDNNYQLFRGELKSSYMNVKQHEGDLVLFDDTATATVPNPSDKATLIKWQSDTFIRNRVQKLFGVGSANRFVLNDLYFDKRGDVKGTIIKPGFRIAREVHEVRSSGWSLKYTAYTPHILSHNGAPVEIPLVYVYDIESFKKWCEQSNIMSDEIQADLWFRSKEGMHFTVFKDKPINLKKKVFQGSIFGSHVIVKTYPRQYIFPPLSLEMWSRNRHIDFVLQFRGAMMREGEYHIAFEKCKCNLFDFIQSSHESTWISVFRTLLFGLRKLHHAGIYHTNINPWNVLVSSDNSARICGFNNFQRPQDHLKQQLEGDDLRDLASLIVFCYCPRYNSQSEENYPRDGRRMIHRMNVDYPAASDAVKCIFYRRGSLFEILCHPFLFVQSGRMDYTKDSSDLLVTLDKLAKTENQKRMHSKPRLPLIILHESRMEARKWYYFDGPKWTNSLPPSVVAWGGRHIQPTNPLSLLRFIRNMLSHFTDVHKAVEKDAQGALFVGRSTEDLENNLQIKFPKLITGVYNYIRLNQTKQQIEEGPLRKYYEFMFV